MRTLQSELERIGLVPKKKPQKRTERLSERDLKELMGMYRPKYKRASGGAFKQF
mgnify:CR=1 FL=1